MIPLGPVVARSRTKASRATVWAYLTEPRLREQWWEGLQLELRLGGEVRSAGRELVGTIDVWVAGHALGFSWRGDGDQRDTAVLITLRSQGFHTGFTVTETGFDALENGAARAETAGRQWGRFVEALAEASFDETAVAEAEVATRAAELERDAAAVVLAAAVVAGEVTDELVTATEDAVEVDAEPEVGDHLELVTGPVATIVEVPEPPQAPEVRVTKAVPVTNSQLDEEIVPLVLPGPPIGSSPDTAPTVVIETPAVSAPVTTQPDSNKDLEEAKDQERTENSEGPQDSEDPEEPDFDSLIKGLF